MIERCSRGLRTIVGKVLRALGRRPRIFRRLRRGCRLILILLLLLSCLTCALLGLLIRQAGAEEPSTDAMLVIDNSNSMFDKDGIGSDPDLRRIEAAGMFISYLGIDSEASHRLGVIFFGGKAKLVVPLTALADERRRNEMASLIARPRRMDWTNPAAALTLARETLLAEGDEGHRPVVVLLTDGKPEWDNNPTQAEQRAVLDRLERIGERYAEDGIRLFVVLLCNQATEADPEIAETYAPLWGDVTGATGGRFYAVRQAEDLFGIYHDILVTLSDARSSRPVIETELEGDLQREVAPVEPGLARVTFLVRRSSPDVRVTIYRPNGKALKARDDDVRHAGRATTSIWAVTQPEAGDWVVLLDGEGSVTVWKDALPAPATPSPVPTAVPTATATPSPTPMPSPSPTPTPELTVGDWPEVWLAGQPITVSASFDPPPSERPEVWIAWDMGEGESAPRRLLDDGRAGDAVASDGEYGMVLTPEEPGVLFVRIWAETQGELIGLWEGRLRLEPRPALELVVPRIGETWQASRRVPIKARWTVGGEPLTAAGPVTASLRAADGKFSQVLTGTSGQTILTEAPGAGGTYTLTVDAAISPAGDPVHRGVVRRAVIVHRSPPGWIWPGTTGLVGISVGAWWLWRHYRRLPRLVGRLRVLNAPPDYVGSSLTDLSSLNRRSARIGGRSAELGLPPQGAPWAEIRALHDESGIELTVCNGRTVQVNGNALAGAHVLADGDTITTDEIELRYEHLHYGL